MVIHVERLFTSKFTIITSTITFSKQKKVDKGEKEQ